MFSTILVPLDGSAESNVALPVAHAIAQSSNGSIWLLRVARESGLRDDHSATHEAAQSIERVANELTSSGLEVHPVTRQGDPAQEILHLSSDIGADVIIMRTHGRAGLERAVFGSVAEEVLQKTRLPLVLVRPGGRRISQIHRLLVPVDGSPGGSVALLSAVDIARATGASIHVLQVVVPIPILAYAAPYDYAGAAFYDSAWDDDALLAARTYVDAVAARLRGLGLPVDAEARMAPAVADAIVAAVGAGSADLIVMSTHALTGPARTLLGSVADAVMRTAGCPVLLVKQAVATPQSTRNEMRSRASTAGNVRPAVAGAVLSNVATVPQLGIVVASVSTDTFAALAPSLILGGVVASVYGAAIAARARGNAQASPIPLGRPFDFRSAFGLATMVSIIMVGSTVLLNVLGETGAILAAAVGGFADAHAAAISISSLVAAGKLGSSAAVVPILVGMTANSITKNRGCLRQVFARVQHSGGGRRDPGGRGHVERHTGYVASPGLCVSSYRKM